MQEGRGEVEERAVSGEIAGNASSSSLPLQMLTYSFAEADSVWLRGDVTEASQPATSWPRATTLG